MSIRWTMEAIMAAIAIIASISGGLFTTVYHSGANAAQVTQLSTHQGEQDKRLDAHDERLRVQENSASAEQATLTAIQAQLDRIEKKL